MSIINLDKFFQPTVQEVKLPVGTAELTELVASRFPTMVDVFRELSPEQQALCGWPSLVTKDKKEEGLVIRDPKDPVPDANGEVKPNALRYMLQEYTRTEAALAETPFPVADFADIFAALRELRTRVVQNVTLPLAMELHDRYPKANYLTRFLNRDAVHEYSMFRVVGYYKALDGSSAKRHYDRNAATATLFENGPGLMVYDVEKKLWVPYSTPSGHAGLFAGRRFKQDLPLYGYKEKDGLYHVVEKVPLPPGITMRIAIIFFIYTYPYPTNKLKTRPN